MKQLTITDFEFKAIRPDMRLALAEVVDEDGAVSERWIPLLKVGGGTLIAGPEWLELLADFAENPKKDWMMTVSEIE